VGLATTERAALADYLQDVGPDRPTLCAGWTTADLLAHLLIRERRPDGAIGLVIPALAGHSDRVRRDLRGRPWNRLVAEFRSGPPIWSPLGWGPISELANGGEFFIHHEDARRGVPGWTPRQLDAAMTDAVAALVRSRVMTFRLRRCPVGLTAVMPGRRPAPLHAGTPVAQLHGEPAEVLLWIAGRSAIDLQVQGDPAAVHAADGFGRRM
jgi:uncharacterized protein (TIGR03085 family)